MNIPPLDPSGAKGEHFHSLVDNTTYPRIFVINDNTRAYPGMLLQIHSKAAPSCFLSALFQHLSLPSTLSASSSARAW